MFKTSMLLTTMLNQSPLKQALFMALSLSPFSASADWSAKLNHMVIKDDFLLARNVSHQATTVGLGYQYDFAKDYYLSTNAYIGLGYDSERPVLSFSDSTQSELNKLFGMDLRLGYQVTDWFAPFFGVQYLRQEHVVQEQLNQELPLQEQLRQKYSESDFLIGAEFNVFEDLSLEFAYSDKKSGNVLLLGLNYKF